MNSNYLKLDNLYNYLREVCSNINYKEIPFYKKGCKLIPKHKDGIFIKEKNRGKFTASAKAHGKSVQEYAKQVLNDPNATPLQKKRANFARNASK